MIHRFTNNITVLYDGDWAGIKASLRGIDMLLEEGMNIKVMLLPDGEDPDSFARKHNATEFQEYIAAHEVDFIRFKTNLLMSDAKGDPYKRSEVIKDIVKSIAVIPEAIVRSEYIKECSQMLHVEERILVAEVAKLKREKAPASSGQSSESASPAQGDAAPANPATPNTALTPEGPASPERTTVQQQPPNWELEKGPLYPKELLIIQQLIRHGEKVIFEERREDGTIETMRVAEFVADDLAQDELTFTTPLFKELLGELMEHLNDEGFTAERYFITHANPEYSKLAVELAEEKYQLSKYHSKNQMVVSDADRLHEIIPHLLIDYKMVIVEMELKDTQNQLRQPAVLNDPALCAETMARYKQLMEVKRLMAKRLGDRVLGT